MTFRRDVFRWHVLGEYVPSSRRSQLARRPTADLAVLLPADGGFGCGPRSFCLIGRYSPSYTPCGLRISITPGEAPA